MSRAIDDLSPEMRKLATELIVRCVEQKIMIFIVDTLRTKEEQAANIAKGVSWTMNSKHLTGDAIDVAPYETYVLHGANKLKWDSEDPVWERIGKIGESIGLKWGVWKKDKAGKLHNIDKGHFERKM